MASQFAVDAAVRHQVFLERFKSGQANKFEKYLKSADKQVRESLLKAGTIDNRRRLLEVQKVVRELLAATYTQWGDDLMDDLFEFADQEAGFQLSTAEKDLDGVSLSAPSTEVIKSVALARPFQNKQVKKLLADFASEESKRIEGVIRQGFFEGRTTDQIVRDIRGTKRRGFKDGAFRQADIKARRIARTAVQHFATVAKDEVYAANDDIIVGVEWVSTLDSRTSDICKGLDGQVFMGQSGPRPPAHPNCRSTTVPVLEDDKIETDKTGKRRLATEQTTRASAQGPTAAGQTYGEWLKRQPASFQDEALGKTKGALFRRGKLPVERFVEHGKPLTLAELEKAYPAVWEKANLD